MVNSISFLRSPKKLRTVVLFLLFVFIIWRMPRSSRLTFTHPTQETMYYVQTHAGEEYLCWAERCGWTRIYPIEFAAKQDSINSIAAVVNKDIAPQDIALKKKIHTYDMERKDQYAPLTGFIFGQNTVVFKMNTPRDTHLYLWNKHDDTLTQLSVDKELLPIQIQPQEKLLLLGKLNEVNGQIDYQIQSLVDNKSSSSMQLNSFSWVGEDSYTASEYIGIPAKTEEYTCPFYADIHNCSSNTRSTTYTRLVAQEQEHALDFSWMSLSLPDGWIYSYPEREIRGTHSVFGIQAKERKQRTLGKLAECYTREFLTSILSANKKRYVVSQYKLKATCSESQLSARVMQLQHPEFKEGKLLLSIKSKSPDISVVDLKKDLDLFKNSLHKAILY